MLGSRLGTGPPPPPSSTIEDVERKLNRSSEVEVSCLVAYSDGLSDAC